MRDPKRIVVQDEVRFDFRQYRENLILHEIGGSAEKVVHGEGYLGGGLGALGEAGKWRHGDHAEADEVRVAVEVVELNMGLLREQVGDFMAPFGELIG